MMKEGEMGCSKERISWSAALKLTLKKIPP
jgi:hypothetical protein